MLVKIFIKSFQRKKILSFYRFILFTKYAVPRDIIPAKIHTPFILLNI